MNQLVSFIDAALNVFLVSALVGLSLVLAHTGLTGLLPDTNGMSYYVDRTIAGNWQDYEGQIIDGDTVKYLIDSFCTVDGNTKESLSSTVCTKKFLLSQQGMYRNRITFNGEEYSKIDTDNKYIDPASNFILHVIYNNNGVTVSLQFIELGVDATSVTTIDAEEATLRNLGIVESELNRLIEQYSTRRDALQQSIADMDMTNVPELKLVYQEWFLSREWESINDELINSVSVVGG